MRFVDKLTVEERSQQFAPPFDEKIRHAPTTQFVQYGNRLGVACACARRRQIALEDFYAPVAQALDTFLWSPRARYNHERRLVHRPDQLRIDWQSRPAVEHNARGDARARWPRCQQWIIRQRGSDSDEDGIHAAAQMMCDRA